MSKIKGDINREMMKNSHVRMINAPALELIAGVLEQHTEGVLAGIREKMDQMKEREADNKDTLNRVVGASKRLLEEIDYYHQQYPGMVKGYVLDAMEEMKKAIKETYK